MDPTLAVIGLNHRTSPVAVRERFWIGEPARYEALHQLLRSEGVEEAIVLATCNRTEFIVWANDVPAAANSVLRFLTHEYRLKLCDWSHFYRLMDDVAFTHLFQVAAGLDSIVLGEPEVSTQLREAWLQARTAGATGRFLDAVVQKALAVSAKIRKETPLGDSTLTFPYAAVELAMGVLGDLSGREVLLLGAGHMGEMAAKCLRSAGATRLHVMNRTQSKADELAYKLGAKAVAWEDRIELLKTADIVVCTTSSPQNIISLEEARAVARARQHKPMVMIDVAVPRNVDPRAGEIDGVFLFDIDGLEEIVSRGTSDRQAVEAAANKIVTAEVLGFRRRLLAERAVPTIVAVRQRLEDLCQQEVEFLRKEFGPFTEDQDNVLTMLAAHISQRIASSLAREMREIPDRTGQDMMTVAVQRLFQLDKSDLVETGQEN
ncbi:MAG: glutamyl-tRNA reductase [Candidatus Korobacteraceae bacterium]